MATSCAVGPMECILYERRFLYKRAPPEGHPPGAEPNSGGLPEKTVIIIAASVGSVVLILALALFYICMRRRRASRRIGQLAQFLPTFMDKEKTEKYFQAHSSSSTLVPPEPSNVHHRARSAPIAFAKGVTDHRNRQLERDGSMGQFQQISLISDDTVAGGDEPRRSLSGSRQRASSSVATPATPVVVSSLHRSVSLNKHERSSPTSRTAPTDFGSPEGNEIIPGPNNSSRFAEGEPISRSSGSPDTNRYSAILDFNLNQGISPHHDDDDYGGPFDPARFSTASVMFDAKRMSTMSQASSDDSVSTSSTDDLHVPPHQKHHSFHSHHTSPVMASRELTSDGVEVPEVARHTRPVFMGGEKQEIVDDEDELQVARFQMAPSSSSPFGGAIPDKQEYDELEPVEDVRPMPPRIVLSQPHGQEMSP